MAENPIHIEYMSITDLAARFHPDNPKDHSIGDIVGSIQTLSYREPPMLDQRSGLMAAGHGRVKALMSMKQQKMDAPDYVDAREDDWYIPVVCGSEFTPEELRAYLAASNRLVELGGWDTEALATLLQDIANESDALLASTGYDGNDLDVLLRNMSLTDAGYSVDLALQMKWGDVDSVTVPGSQENVALPGPILLERAPDKRRAIVSTQTAALSELIPELPASDTDLHIIAVGRGKQKQHGDVVQTFGFGNFVDYVTGMFGPGCTVHLATWSMNRDHAFMLLEFLESGRIGKLVVFVDPSLTNRKKAIASILLRGIERFPDSAAYLFPNHAKVYCFASADKSRFCTVTGSGNLSGLPRPENYTLTTSPALYQAYVSQFFDVMIAECASRMNESERA